MTATTQPTVRPEAKQRTACMPGLLHDFNDPQSVGLDEHGRKTFICCNCGITVYVTPSK